MQAKIKKERQMENKQLHATQSAHAKQLEDQLKTQMQQVGACMNQNDACLPH